MFWECTKCEPYLLPRQFLASFQFTSNMILSKLLLAFVAVSSSALPAVHAACAPQTTPAAPTYAAYLFVHFTGEVGQPVSRFTWQSPNEQPDWMGSSSQWSKPYFDVNCRPEGCANPIHIPQCRWKQVLHHLDRRFRYIRFCMYNSKIPYIDTTFLKTSDGKLYRFTKNEGGVNATTNPDGKMVFQMVSSNGTATGSWTNVVTKIGATWISAGEGPEGFQILNKQ
ncbi:hypothetical protein BJ742DRAFT_381763 [Cladochytrium replicatum]|nr:hypothetical protein BJ742DRAFT_381763 [Cladochytrium replicatum]